MARAHSFVLGLALLTVTSCAGGNYATTMQPQFVKPNQQIVTGTMPTAEACHRLGFHLFPSHGTTQVNSAISIRDKLVRDYGTFCIKLRESAKWRSSGGKLKVNPQHWEATFSSTVPGIYTVNAVYGTFKAASTITVTSL